MLRVLARQLASASDPNDNAHQAEGERHSGRRRARAEMHTARYAATSAVVRIADVHAPATTHDRPRGACCHADPSASDLGYTDRQITSAPGRRTRHRSGTRMTRVHSFFRLKMNRSMTSDTPMLANGAETGLDAFAITPALERVAPELLTLVADQVSSTACRDPSRCGPGA